MGYGQRIKQARLDLASKRGRTISQVEIAEAVGVSSTTVGYWEVERSEPADLSMWKRLAKALEEDPGWLAFGVRAPEIMDMINPAHDRKLTDEELDRADQQASQTRAARGRKGKKPSRGGRRH